MSDASKSPNPSAPAEAPKFTERELQLLGWAMQSLKSGPPEVLSPHVPTFRNTALTSADRYGEARKLRRHVQPPLRRQRMGDSQEEAHDLGR
jgi:hypothetical protein